MRFHLIILALSVIMILTIGGCKNEELERQNAQLQSRTDSLNQDLASRDEYIEEITESINDIYDNLEGARAKEKQVIRQTEEMESRQKMTRAQLRQNLIQQIATIDSGLQNNRKRLDDVQAKLKTSRRQYAGLQKMVTNLKQTLEEREQAIAQLQTRVTDLEGQVTQQRTMITQRDSAITEQQNLIGLQTTRINTGYYVIGSRDELEEKGIISSEGGFLWGLLGSSTILNSTADNSMFRPIDKTKDMTIEVPGGIDEIIPKRNTQFFVTDKPSEDRSVLRIVQPDAFWRTNYLVIITD